MVERALRPQIHRRYCAKVVDVLDGDEPGAARHPGLVVARVVASSRRRRGAAKTRRRPPRHPGLAFARVVASSRAAKRDGAAPRNRDADPRRVEVHFHGWGGPGADRVIDRVHVLPWPADKPLPKGPNPGGYQQGGNQTAGCLQSAVSLCAAWGGRVPDYAVEVLAKFGDIPTQRLVAAQATRTR